MSEDTERLLGSIEAKIDMVLKRLDPLEARIRDLEQWRWKVVGITTAASAGIGWLLKNYG